MIDLKSTSCSGFWTFTRIILGIILVLRVKVLLSSDLKCFFVKLTRIVKDSSRAYFVICPQFT